MPTRRRSQRVLRQVRSTASQPPILSNGAKMPYSYKRFCKKQPKSFVARLARALACLALAPIVLAIGYLVVIGVFAALWMLAGLIGEPAALVPYAFIAIIFMLLLIGVEIRRNRRLYREYMSTQSKQDLETVALSSGKSFTPFDRKMAVSAIYDNQQKLSL